MPSLEHLSGNLLDTQPQWYDRKHTRHQSIAPSSGAFGNQKRGASQTIGDTHARGIAGTPSLRRTHFSVVALTVEGTSADLLADERVRQAYLGE